MTLDYPTNPPKPDPRKTDPKTWDPPPEVIAKVPKWVWAAIIAIAGGGGVGGATIPAWLSSDNVEPVIARLDEFEKSIGAIKELAGTLDEIKNYQSRVEGRVQKNTASIELNRQNISRIAIAPTPNPETNPDTQKTFTVRLPVINHRDAYISEWRDVQVHDGQRVLFPNMHDATGSSNQNVPPPIVQRPVTVIQTPPPVIRPAVQSVVRPVYAVRTVHSHGHSMGHAHMGHSMGHSMGGGSAHSCGPSG